MKVIGKQDLQPQTEEGILDIKWLTAKEAEKFFPQTFPSVVDVIKKWIS
jgi:hypothetical protein